MDGYATLHQLLNSPPGTTIAERRGGGYVLEPGTAEYCSTYRALPPGPAGPGTAIDLQRRLEALEALLTETDRKLEAWS
jgi:hypothetical protein